MIAAKTPDDIWSHPEIPLSQHLVETAENMMILLSQTGIPHLELVDDECSMEMFQMLARLVAALHDIGKSTLYFQKYIRDVKYVNKALKAHAKIGSVFVFWTVLSSPDFDCLNKNRRVLFAFIASVVVRKHHLDLSGIVTERKNLKNALDELWTDKQVLNKQLKSIDPVLQDQIIKKVSDITHLTIPPWSQFESLNADQVKELSKKTRDFSKWWRKVKNQCASQNLTETSFEVTILLNYLYSLLQESDKVNAMGREVVKRCMKDYWKVLEDYYLNQFGPSRPKSVTNIRESRPHIFDEVVAHAQNFDLSERILSLESPTGSGKTLSNLGWAFTLRKRLGQKHRVVYILPFTSIIEQTHQILQDILNQEEEDVTELVKHHYLAKVKFSSEENEDLTPNEELFFIQGWNGEIILSTFVQFFHSLFTVKKGRLRKYSKFMNSIIVVDEIQAYPPRYWGLFNEFVPRFLRYTNSYLLMSTATLPGIVDRSLDSVSSTAIRTFNLLDRTRIIFSERSLRAEDLVEFLSSQGVFDRCRNFLFVLNTINSSKVVYHDVRKLFPDAEMFYLSGSLIPKERQRVISEVTRALDESDQFVILVSTQVIEAGVDLSFEAGYRDIAPLDSLIQSVGRINRSDSGSVHNPCHVIPLRDTDRNFLLARYVYDSILLDATINLLTESKSIDEKDYRGALQKYFRRIKEGKNTSSKEIVESLCKGDLHTLSRDFHLIEKDHITYPVFVELDDEAEDLWAQYIDIRAMKDWKDRRNAFAKLRPRMNEYIINVSVRDVPDLEDHNWLYRLPRDRIYYSYNTVTGFVRFKDRDSLDPI